MRMFTTPERDAGFALKGDDIVSVFKHPKAPYRNVTKSMLDLAKQNGGRRLDAFDTVLPHLYAQSGFRSVARLPWNEQYKPDGWKHDDFKEFKGGRPDVTFMVHDPQAGSYQPGDGRPVADYDEGTAHQHAALAHVAARGNVPAAPGPEAYGSGQLIRMADPLTVHHGTPHEFKGTRANPLGEFDLSKLGTGEGAQAYGKGIYQAGNKGVAEGYRDDLSGGVTYQGQVPKYSHTDPHALAVHQVAEYMRDLKMTPEQAIVAVRSEYEDSHASSSRPWPGEPPSQQEAMRRRAQFHLGVSMAAQRLQPRDFTNPTGQLYESELHIHPDHMLDWDKPLREQHPYVQDRAAALSPPMADATTQLPDGRWVLTANGQPVGRQDGWPDRATAQYVLHAHRQEASTVRGMTGEQFHHYHANRLGKEGVAPALLQAGIPGIRYLDAGSRGHAEDARRLENQIAMMGPNAPQRDIDVAHQRLAQTKARISHNYVVLDPRTLNVVKRNGLPAMVDAGADALREHKAAVT